MISSWNEWDSLKRVVVGDATYAGVVAHFGERGVVDLMATLSYYTLVCMSLNVDGYPLPDGVQPELLPLA
jgi:hypothetical protein